MLQIQRKHHWLLRGWCAQYYKNKIIQRSFNIKTLFDETEGFHPALNNCLLSHAYSIDFFFQVKTHMQTYGTHYVVF
jgi:hypothetical protein